MTGTIRHPKSGQEVRMPTTVPRVQRLKERRRAQAQQRRKEEATWQVTGGWRTHLTVAGGWLMGLMGLLWFNMLL